MIDTQDQIIDLPIDDFREHIQKLQRSEIVSIAAKLEAENERLKRQLAKMDPGLEPYDRKEGFRGFILGKLRLCHDRLAELKAEAVTLGIFFKLDDDGLPFFYYRAARLSPQAYQEALFDKYGADAPVMTDTRKISPERVPTDLWDDLSVDSEPHHELFSL